MAVTCWGCSRAALLCSEGHGVTETRGTERHHCGDQNEAVLAEDEPLGGHWLSTTLSWKPPRLFAASKLTAPQLQRTETVKDNPDTLSASLSHGDASWDELGAFSTPGYLFVLVCPSPPYTDYSHARSCSLPAQAIKGQQVEVPARKISIAMCLSLPRAPPPEGRRQRS